MKLLVALIVAAIVMRILIGVGTPYPLALIAGTMSIGFTQGALGGGGGSSG